MGCRFPVVGGIPRFVPSENYASSFGLQWKSYRTTQLDSHTAQPISRERLTRCLGGSMEVVRGKSVLEAGCGAGRFTEVLLDAGAEVFALDLSDAVEANYANCYRDHGYFVCQASLLEAPVLPGSFDIVLCLGVIQHTPCPEATISKLASHVKPGGMLVIDHYAPHYKENFTRRWLRRALIRMPSRLAFYAVRGLSRLFIPLHRVLRPPHRIRGVGRLRNALLRFSPMIDYYEYLRELPTATIGIWMELDTHDALTDVYKHLRSVEQIQQSLQDCGLVDVCVWIGGNGVEACGYLPEEAMEREGAA